MAGNAVKTPLLRAARNFSGQSQLNIQTSVLPNKLLVASSDNGSSISRVAVVYKAGSRNETGDSQGATHTIRLAAGLSTEKSSQFGIIRNLQQLGANLSASTDRETVAYTLEGTRDLFGKALPFLGDTASRPTFRPWELSDQTSRLKLELATLPPQVKVLDLLHKAAFRQTLGNSLFVAEHNVGKVSPETLQHYFLSNFTGNRAAVVGLGVDHKDLVKFAEELGLQSGGGSIVPSAYYGGEIRKDEGGELAYVAVATAGGAIAKPEEAIAFALLQKVLGNGPYAKRGNESSSTLAKYVTSAVGDSPFAISGLNVSYSDNGLFGFIAASSANSIGTVVKNAVKALRTAQITDDDICRAKTQLKANVLFGIEDSAALLEDLGLQAVLNGDVKDPTCSLDAISNADHEQIKAAFRKVATSKLSLAAVGNLNTLPYLDELK